MGSSPDDDDVERVDRDYVDPNSTTRAEIREDLEEAGIEGDAATAFEDRMLDVDAVVDTFDDSVGVVTREDVEKATSGVGKSVPHNADREDAITDAAAEEIGAPSESGLQQARGSAARLVDEEGNIRSNPDLDPLGGGEGRVIGSVDDVTENTGGRGGGFTEGVEPTGSGKGTYFIEDADGNRYPLSEVDI